MGDCWAVSEVRRDVRARSFGIRIGGLLRGFSCPGQVGLWFEFVRELIGAGGQSGKARPMWWLGVSGAFCTALTRSPSNWSGKATSTTPCLEYNSRMHGDLSIQRREIPGAILSSMMWKTLSLLPPVLNLESLNKTVSTATCWGQRSNMVLTQALDFIWM